MKKITDNLFRNTIASSNVLSHECFFTTIPLTSSVINLCQASLGGKQGKTRKAETVECYNMNMEWSGLLRVMDGVVGFRRG